ncbi:ResB-like protein [Candidatus Koribacter versatilis Ellin345]|uniref:ResB-like protein n=1 Tax=Koribacter versatilis (strain Ellin345) TaxID=204669 RepID=Q1ITP7_KORVE|nr:cytochrome c biogenesis protein ResB [Candidatus Koribacter versatilis]ABF39753.1 ResB-like protein [Candidatus Koribacter versatilis Ellin345]
MSAQKQNIPTRIFRTFASLRTGITLLILVVIAAAIGTFILQRPTTDADKIAQAYSPTALYWLDRLTLTDIFHAWWFATLLALVSVSIVCASIDRWPNAWRFYARPYRKPDPHFRAVLPNHTELPIADPKLALNVAEKALLELGYKPERIVDADHVSLYSEKNRFSVMAVYVVHASLLLIFLGGIIDAVVGYRGFMAIVNHQSNNTIELRDGGKKVLPYAVVCNDTGQERYEDGTPKKWWSKLAVVRDGKVVQEKEIVVNDPLVYDGLRFYQASWGMTGDLDQVSIVAEPFEGGSPQTVGLSLNKAVNLDPQTTVTMFEFIPDFFVRDNQIFRRSNDPVNPAFHLKVNRAGTESLVWLMPAYKNTTEDQKSPFKFSLTEGPGAMRMVHYTGLEVSHQPGQWAIWAGVLLMGVGLGVAFYMVHVRFWIMPVETKDGQLVLWIGGSANKNKDKFEEKYYELVAKIRHELGIKEVPAAEEEEKELAHV